ncbi:hypothetical protein TRVL_02659 [Trypanosoma vivax]|nr:hypothetical protein TRVL_02659 [Trypanosoma vivax]
MDSTSAMEREEMLGQCAIATLFTKERDESADDEGNGQQRQQEDEEVEVEAGPRSIFPPLVRAERASGTEIGVTGSAGRATVCHVVLSAAEEGEEEQNMDETLGGAACGSEGETTPMPKQRHMPQSSGACISYNVRTVVRRSEHPLWSKSTEKRLDFLFPKQLKPVVSQRSCRREENNKYFPHSSGAAPLSGRYLASSLRSPPCCAGAVKNGSTERLSWPRPTFEATLPTKVSLTGASWANYATGTTEEESVTDNRRRVFVDGEWKFLRPMEMTTLFLLLLRDECIAREAIVEEERYDALRSLPFGLLPGKLTEGCPAPHPALVDGCYDIVCREEIHRKCLLEEESNAIAPLWDLFSYVHRGLVLGSGPLRKFLCQCVWRYRGRKQFQNAQREHLFDREKFSRSEILNEWWDTKQELLNVLLIAKETLFRGAILSLQLLAEYAHGVAWIGMQQHVEIFPLLYGTVMPKAVVCGRIAGTTVFRQADLSEQFHRQQISKWERGDRDAIQFLMEREALVKFVQVECRQRVEEEENKERARELPRIFALMERFHRREIEIVEACELEIDLLRKHAPIAGTGSREQTR